MPPPVASRRRRNHRRPACRAGVRDQLPEGVRARDGRLAVQGDMADAALLAEAGNDARWCIDHRAARMQCHVVATVGFWIFDNNAVALETPSAAVEGDSSPGDPVYLAMFDKLRAKAVQGEQARRMSRIRDPRGGTGVLVSGNRVQRRSLCPRLRSGATRSRTGCLSRLSSGKPACSLRSTQHVIIQPHREHPAGARDKPATSPRSAGKVVSSSCAVQPARSSQRHCVQ